MRDTREAFWKARVKNYEKLEWAIKGGYLHAFLDAGAFGENDYVLDVGTGTGIIAHTLAPFVKKTIGIDVSAHMLKKARQHRTANEDFVKMDARSIKFGDKTFSKVTARMVFHHILNNTQKAMDECYRVLKEGGRMIFSEGIPPAEHVKSFYIEMFRLKEERLTFMESDLLALMKKSGFSNIKKAIYWLRQASIRNWLENSGVIKEKQEKIIQMHRDLDSRGKKYYNMQENRDDCFIDMKFVILIGER